MPSASRSSATRAAEPVPPVSARARRIELVIKIGGSLLESGRLAATLGVIARARRGLVVVPGGGPFADKVRAAQAARGFDDVTAHRLALSAMQRMAQVMAAMCERLAPAATLAEMRGAAASGAIPVWLPLKLAGRDRTIPADWSITSDGLAARLAERLGVETVVLMKSCSVAPGGNLAELAEGGIVDAAFGDIVARAGLAAHVLGPADAARLRTLLDIPREEPASARARRDRGLAARLPGGGAHGQG